jgi:hypothetical protein
VTSNIPLNRQVYFLLDKTGFKLNYFLKCALSEMFKLVPVKKKRKKKKKEDKFHIAF